MIHTFVFFNPFFLFTLFLFAFFIQPYRQCIIRAQTHPVLNVFNGVVLKYSYFSSHTYTAPASSTCSPKAKWGLGNSRACEKRERGMMGTSVEREREVMGRKRRERGKLLPFFSPSHHSLRPRFP